MIFSSFIWSFSGIICFQAGESLRSETQSFAIVEGCGATDVIYDGECNILGLD